MRRDRFADPTGNARSPVARRTRQPFHRLRGWRGVQWVHAAAARVREAATARRILVAVLVAFAYSAWFFLGPYADVSPHGGIVDERFGISGGEAREHIDDLGPDGREAYRTFLLADLVFPLLHASWITGFLAVGRSAWKALPAWVLGLPVLALLADWLENGMLLLLLAQHPAMSGAAAGVGVVALHVKFAANAVALLFVVLVVGRMVMDPMGRRRK